MPFFFFLFLTGLTITESSGDQLLSLRKTVAVLVSLRLANAKTRGQKIQAEASLKIKIHANPGFACKAWFTLAT